MVKNLPEQHFSFRLRKRDAFPEQTLVQASTVLGHEIQLIHE